MAEWAAVIEPELATPPEKLEKASIFIADLPAEIVPELLTPPEKLVMLKAKMAVRPAPDEIVRELLIRPEKLVTSSTITSKLAAEMVPELLMPPE
jgi:hypothetical protein